MLKKEPMPGKKTLIIKIVTKDILNSLVVRVRIYNL